MHAWDSTLMQEIKLACFVTFEPYAHQCGADSARRCTSHVAQGKSDAIRAKVFGKFGKQIIAA